MLMFKLLCSVAPCTRLRSGGGTSSSRLPSRGSASTLHLDSPCSGDSHLHLPPCGDASRPCRLVFPCEQGADALGLTAVALHSHRWI
jgi:hypothetical protein